MRRAGSVLTATLVLALAPGLARGQSYWLHAATLRLEGHSVAQVSRLPVSLTWSGATTAVARYADEAVALEAAIDLRDAETYLSAGVGVPVVLAQTDGWTLSMSTEAWAPVLGFQAGGTLIALPSPLPLRQALLPASTPGARTPPKDQAWSWHREPNSDAAGCGGLEVAAAPGSPITWRLPPDAAVRLGAAGGQWRAAEVSVGGFSLKCVAPTTAACDADATGMLGLAGVGAGCGDGMARGRAVLLPAGTELFATATSARAFARLKRQTRALEPLFDPAAQRCSSDRCRRIPPEPAGTARWIVDLDCQRGPPVVLTGWVKVPAESLSDAEPPRRNPGGGFGLCSSPPSDWPR